MNAVVTLAIGSQGKEFLDVSGPIMAAYARRIGSEFIVISEHKVLIPYASVYPYDMDKLQVVDILRNHERVVFMDADILVTPKCPDIFADLGDPEYIGWTGRYDQYQADWLRTDMRTWGYKGNFDTSVDGGWVAGGMFVMSQCHHNVLNMCLWMRNAQAWGCIEPLMHFVTRSMWPKIKRLDPRYNHTFMGYEPSVETYVTGNIHRRLYDAALKQGCDLRTAWKDAYTVHYTNAALTVTQRVQYMQDGITYFYGRERMEVI